MRVIARKTLKDFWEKEPAAQTPLEAWFAEARNAEWTSPADVKASYATASILKDGRVVFNVGGNKYRLVVWINYAYFTIYVRFVGTHKEYDGIDAQTIQGNGLAMRPKVIKTEAEHQAALARIDKIFDAKPHTPKGDEFELLVLLVEDYEDRVHTIDLPDPIAALRFRMEQAGLAPKDLIPYVGSKSKVSEVLRGRRPLSLTMIRKLVAGLRLPAEVALQAPPAAPPPRSRRRRRDQRPLATGAR